MSDLLGCERCGETLREDTTPEELSVGVRAWTCPRCGEEMLTNSQPGTANVPPPANPTTAKPGSPEKIAVMAARAACGQAIFHPGDARGLSQAPSAQTGGRRDRLVGVIRHRGRWRARAWCRRRKVMVSLGLYLTPEEAAAAVVAWEEREARRKE